MRDKRFAKQFWGKPCIVCGNTEGSVGHHFLSLKAHPEFAKDLRNIFVVCHSCHRGFHDMGAIRAVEVYNLEAVMIGRGFKKNPITGRWYLI